MSTNLLKNKKPLPESLKIQIMYLLIEEIKTERHEDGSELAKINEVFNRMEVNEMLSMLSSATGFEVSCNIDELVRAICNVSDKNKIQNEIVWLLQHGATNAMINRFYPSDAEPSKLAILRKNFCESTHKGREKSISKLKDIDKIQKDWHRMQTISNDTFEKLQAMQYKWPCYNIYQIWMALVP
jgi:hypothetical protein